MNDDGKKLWEISLKITFVSSADRDKIKVCLERGIYRGLDTEGNCLITHPRNLLMHEFRIKENTDFISNKS